MPDERFPLDDPAYAKFAWGRFKRLLGWMGLVSLICGAIAVWLLQRYTGILPLHMGIASFLGVTLTVFLAAALMGLIFLSSGSGHDEQVDRFNHDPDVDTDR
ncbi:hypothetical protein [Sphingomonas japonica]|nr:hypothetical protein [Sphingomonas japonica]